MSARTLRRALITLVLCAMTAATSAGAAGGAGRPAAVPYAAGAASSPQVQTSVYLNPVRTSHGVKVGLFLQNCGKHQSLQATYTLTRGRARITHDYTGKAMDCSVNAGLTSGELSVGWGRSLHADLTLASTKRPTVSYQRLGKNCIETFTEVQVAATGSLRGALHARQFGSLDATRLTGTLLRTDTPSCAGGFFFTYDFSTGGAERQPTTAQYRHGTFFGGDLGGSRFLEAQAIPTFPSEIYFDEPVSDRPAGTRSDFLELTITGGDGFVPAANFATATLNFATPLSQGSLTFTAGTGCPPGVRAREGALSGTVTIDDPVVGQLMLDGADVKDAELSAGDARTDRCQQNTGGN